MREESTPILIGEASFRDRVGIKDKEILYSPETILSNFRNMCFAFSVNHAAVVACIVYASAELGDELGGVCNGILYVAFAVSAFLISNPVVTGLGGKRAMLIGTIGFSIYVFGFLFAVMMFDTATDLSWIIGCIAALIGGCAGGLLWTSQGRIFAQHSDFYAQSSGMDPTKVHTRLAAQFATYFLGSEMTAKVLATVVYLLLPSFARFLLFFLYAVLAMLSCLVIAGLDSLDDNGSGQFSYKAVSHSAGAAARLIYKDPRVLLLLPFQIAYGFAMSMVTYYVSGTIIANSTHLGDAFVGLLSAVAVLAGSLFAIPSAQMASALGKPSLMMLGSACVIIIGLAFLVTSDEVLAQWAVIIPYLVIFGVGRGVWENTNKAVIADFFTGNEADATTAFSATAFFTGYASGMGFFTFFSMERQHMGYAVVIPGIISAISTQAAFLVDKSMKDKQKWDSRKMRVIKEKLEECQRERESHEFTTAESAVPDNVLL